MPSHPAENAGNALRVCPIGGRIGAFIEGVRPSGALDSRTIDTIRSALLKHKVVIFRGVDAVDDADMEGFTERLGTPLPHPMAVDPKGSRYLLNVVEMGAVASSIWHTDMSYLPAYPAISVIWPVTLPASGGDTMWVNSAAAYDDLPPPLKAMADELWAVHSSDISFDLEFVGEKRKRVDAFARMDAFPSRWETEHPLVRVHPETGERSLLLGTYVKRLAGFDIRQSHHILSLFQDYLNQPENCLRWRWQMGDIVIWDNRSTQHRAVADFGDQARNLRRATTYGTHVTGINGAESRIIEAPEAQPVQ